MTAIAELSDSATISGSINDVTLSADSTNKAATTSTAGGAAAGGSGVGIGGAISLSLLNTDTKTYLGSGSALTIDGDLSAKATHTGSVVTKGDGAASGGAAAIGIALGLNIVNDSTLSTTARTISAGGDVSFIAHAAAATAATGTASAAGAEDEEKAAATNTAAGKTFNADAAATKVDLTANTIDMGAAHGLKSGTAVVYSKGADTNTAIGGLVNGKTYYVITGTGNTIKLAATAADASKGTAIDLRPPGPAARH